MTHLELSNILSNIVKDIPGTSLLGFAKDQESYYFLYNERSSKGKTKDVLNRYKEKNEQTSGFRVMSSNTPEDLIKQVREYAKSFTNP